MKNLPQILSGISLLALIVTIGIIIQRTQEAQKQSTQEVLSSNTSVISHSTPSDCWVTIDQKTYNLTSFLTSHPGGSLVIEPYCGKDGTKAYHSKDRQPAQSHSQSADALLAKYLINSSSSTPVPITITPIPTLKLTNSTSSSHNTSADCWIIISGKTYAVTAYLALHPGGASVITLYCGRDATNAFQTKNGQGSHSSFAQGLLSNYLVGSVAVATKFPTPIPTSTPVSSASSASHSTPSDCWVTINSNLYNLTNYLVQHPGGVNVITPYCGKDGSSAFNSRGGTGSHSNFAKSLLNNYLVSPSVTTTLSNPTSIPTSNCADLPLVICAKYPGAVKTSGKYEDEGEWEGKINTSSGACRSIKVNSSASISEDQPC